MNDKWRPDRPVAATTTWADYEEAFADVELSVAFTIARTAARVVPELNDYVAEFVAAAPGRRLGFLSIHPEVPGAARRARTRSYGARPGRHQTRPELPGVRSARVPPALRIYELAERHGLPILFHQGASPVREAPLRFAHPLLMDEVAIRFPELRVVMAHLGHPWQRETIVTIRKHPHVYADVSALFYRRGRSTKGCGSPTNGARSTSCCSGRTSRSRRRSRPPRACAPSTLRSPGPVSHRCRSTRSSASSSATLFHCLG